MLVRVLRQGNTRLILVFLRLRASQTAGTLAFIKFSLSSLQGPLACEGLDNLLYEGHTPPVSWESRAHALIAHRWLLLNLDSGGILVPFTKLAR